MEKKNQNEELQSRREFFKKAAKGALPILGAIVLAGNPLLSKAAEEPTMGCDYNCVYSCYTYCQNTCSGRCDNSCSGSCRTGCSGSCNTTCYSTCMGTCRYSSY